MDLVNRFVGWVFDLLTVPLRGLPQLAGLVVLSLVGAVVVLLVFRLTSKPERITAAKRRIEAGLFEVRLFDDEPRIVLRALGDMLRANLAYLRASFVPALCTLVPLVLLMAQMQALYGYRAVRPGETFVLQARLAPAPSAGGARDAGRPRAQLRVPPGLQVETPEVWIPALAELAWRVRAERAGRYRVELDVDGTTAAKDVAVGSEVQRVSPIRQRAAIWARVLYPVEPPLAATGGLESIQVRYRVNHVALFTWRLPWIVVFVALVTAFALALKGRFRVAL